MRRQNLRVPVKKTPSTLIRVTAILCLAILILVWASAANAQSAPPAIFFTDLTSGPNSGGENVSGSSGTYVTIYGNFFGATQGNSTVTLNGANCLRVVSWGSSWMWYQKIVVQLGSSCTSGNLVVTTGAGSSAGAPFTVRPGNIYCVSITGNNTNTGLFPNSCWATLLFAKNSMAAGDIVYALNGVTQTPGQDQFSSTLVLQPGGSTGTPKALVAYPGATVTVNTATGDKIGIRVYSQSWVIAGLKILGGSSSAILSGNGGVQDARIVGNDLSCPNANDQSGCLGTGSTTFAVYGNLIHDVSANDASSVTKLWHAVYLGDGTVSVDFGWNTIRDNHGNRGVQVYCGSCPGSTDIYDIHIHDNLIFNNRGVAILFNQVNPDKGTIEAYNNVVYNAGIGPDFTDGATSYDCTLTSTFSNTTQIQLYNNTLYNCGFSGGGGGGCYANGNVNLVNNICVQPASFAYFDGVSQFNCSNNLFFGAGAPPSGCGTGAINVSPLFNNLTALDFHLSATSPAIDAGVTRSGLKLDRDGVTRPQGSAYDVGAYEFFAGGSSVQLPNPPTNLTVTVQ